VGADADIAVFDAGRIIDKATFDNPAVPSEGVRYLIVAGTPVVRDGKLDVSKRPGQAVRGAIR
jgi:N-acyl-D-aspartate/D-glutamate deacylase